MGIVTTISRSGDRVSDQVVGIQKDYLLFGQSRDEQ
jgi:hypothetical protein